MHRFARLWRTTTVRLTAVFILIFVLFSVLLLAFIAYQVSAAIQRQQTNDINREIGQLRYVGRQLGFRSLVVTVQRLAARPGPGVYYLGDPVGQQLAGNIDDVPTNVLAEPGAYTFPYRRQDAFLGQLPGTGSQRRQREGRTLVPPADPDQGRSGHALVRSVHLDNGLHLVVGRDIAERRGFAAIIVGGFVIGVAGIILFSAIAGGLTSVRVLRRIDSITGTSTKIMAGNLSERVPVTRKDDEFDRLATSLNAMFDRIEELMKGLKEVSDNVAHDLKTPLTRMRNRAEAALRASSTSDDRIAALTTTIAESDQLIRTFNALLKIARAEAGTPSAALGLTDIGAVAADVVDLYGPVAEEAGFVLDGEITEGLNMIASRELIGQALVNLVENAIKYGGPAKSGSRIVIAVSEVDNCVRIEVADNGPGIPAGDRSRVLKRFVRLEESRTEPGSGLGLSLVAAVAHQHKGSFRIEDNKPGTRAILDLPKSA